MKKGNNTGNDDFSFSTDGGDEFFPLNVEKSKKDTKAPKGVKGYLKNVARSVVNLGVKTSKHLYPEAFELGEKFKPDTTSTTDTKAYIANWRAETKKYADIGKDIVGNVVKDAKEAVKTGKFVKTEDERNNAEEMFGEMFGDDGFDFGGDSVSFGSDVDGYDSNFDLGSDDDNDSVGATLNVGSTVIKSSYANARINTKLSEKTNATIVGATQTQIKSDRAMFTQNLEISQEQHRQKMLMMTNIATNIGKIIEQGNVSIKAQMEFSAKQLAFSQDLASMVKEVRDAQWSQIKPKNLNDAKKSKFQSIFGNGKTSGFNFEAFKKNFFNNMKSNAAGGAFDMLGTGKEMIDMMMDMGGGPGALKNMITDMLFETTIDAITGGRSTYGAKLLNSKLEGLPGAINRKLNSISKRGAPGLENILSKLPFDLGNKINLKELAGWAHVDNDVKIKSGKYDMDPSEVHPFDNAAHKALTEVIPWQLAKIDAGINRTEQEFFNYKSNKWEKVSSIRKHLDRTREEVLEYSNGYSAINDRLAAGIDLKNSYKQILTEYETNPTFRAGYYNKTWDKDTAQAAVNLSSEAKKFIMKNKKILIHNVMMVASDEEMDDVLASLLDSESDNFPRFFEGVPSPTGELTEEIVAYYLYNTIKEFSKAEPQEWISFQTDLASYKDKLTSNNFENEDKYFGAGAGIAFDASISSDIFENERNELNKEREKLEKKRKVLLSKDAKTKKLEDLSSKYLGKKVESIKDIDEQLKRLRAAERDLNEREATSTTGMLKVHSPSDADKFIISDLHDSSTNGLLNNIFNLLLTGLDVYVKNPSGKQYEYHKQIIDNALSIKEAAVKKPKDSETEEDESSTFGVDSVDKTLADREASFNSDENAFGSKLIAKIPGMKSVYRAFNKATNSVNSLGNRILGENFYSVHDSFQPIDENGEYFKTVLTEEERSKYRELKKQYDSAPKEDKDKIKSEIKTLLSKAKNSKAAKSLKFGANIFTSAFNRSELSKSIKVLGSKLSKVSLKGKTLGEYVSETNNSELNTKLSEATSVGDKINIIRDMGSSKAKAFADEAQKQYNANKSKFDADFKDAKSSKYTLDSIKAGLGKKIYSGLSSIQNKVLGNELVNIKDDKGNKLKDTLAEINSQVLNYKLSKEPDPAEKSKILLNVDYKELEPFKPKIEEFRAKALEELSNSDSIKGILGNFKNKIFDTVKNKIGGKLAAMNQNRILSGDLIKLKNKETGKTIGEIVAEINDPSLIEKLNSAKSVDEKINILLAYDNPQLNKCKQDLVKFKKSIASDTSDKSFGGIIAWTKRRGKENLDKFIKNTLVKKLKKIKVGDKTLGEVLGEIAKKDPSFGEKIESFTTMTDLAEFLLQSTNPELQPFKKAIRELKEKHMEDEAQGGVAGIVGMGLVTGFDMIKKAIDGVKNLFSKRKKDANEELSIIEKYVHPDIVKLFGGTKATMDIIDSLGIDVELAFKDNEYHKASKQIEFILDANKTAKRLNSKQKRALKGLMRYELDKEAASASINSINSSISSINNNFKNEISKYGDSMSSSEKKQLEDTRDEDLDRENRKLDKAKKRKDKASKKINKVLGEEDSIEGNSASEQREAKAKAKEEKEKAKENKMRFGLLSTLVSTITGWKKKGFKLDDETTNKMQDAISEGAKEGSSEGWSGKISSFMDKTGLSNTKLGKGIQFAVNKGGSIARHITGNSKITSLLGKSKIGSTVLGAAGKFGGGAVAASSGSSILGGITSVVGGAGGALGGLTKVLEKLLSTPKILAKLGKTGVKSVISGIKTGAKRVLTKIFPKLTILNGMATNWIGWAALVANAITSFIKGMARAKTTFNIGRGLRPTNGMRAACGLAAMFDGVLLGIPGIIGKSLGFRNAEEWFYSLIGKTTEKEALGRYAKYNSMRATIFGIDDPKNLIAFENRNLEKGGNFFDNLGSGAKRLGRSIANIATFGIAKNNDERDSQLLGFQSVDIFKMWKEKKYIPLTTECVDKAIAKLREEKKDDEILANLDDAKLKKYLEQMNAVSKEDLDNNGDGEVDENSKAEAEAAALEHQNTYRKIYLEICRSYVLENKIAWLTSHCTLEKFKKYTGKDAQTDLSGKDRAKRAAGIITNPVGSLAAGVLKKKGSITEKEAKSVKKMGTAVAATAIATMVGGPLGGLLVGGGIALVAGVKKARKERKHIGRAIANTFRRGATKGLMMDPYTKMERTRIMSRFSNTKKVRANFVKKLIEIADKYGEGHIDEWEELNEKLHSYNNVMNPGIDKQMAETFAKCANYKYQDDNGNVTDMVAKTLGISIPNDHPDRDIIAVASGMVGWVAEYMPELDGMCQSILGMTIKHLAVKMIVKGEKIAKAANNYEKYITRRAEILGAPQNKLKAYESGLKGGDKATGWGRFRAGFKSFFSRKDSDELDSNRIGFEDVKIYKYWKQHKYDPIIAIEKRIAGKYGKYLEIIDKHCEDVEAQNKFINEFFKEATKYVNDNGLAWLTTKTTLKEFEEIEKKGFKSGATMATIATIREQRRAEIQAQLNETKQGSRKYKKLQKDLERMNMSTTGSTSSNNIDLKRDFDELSAELMKNYDQAGLAAHETASTIIRDDIWKPAGSNFYGDNPGIVARNDVTANIGEERGGPDSFGTLGSTDNIRILKEKATSGTQNALNQIKQRSNKVATEEEKNVVKKAPGLLDKVSSKVSIKQTPINDFIIDFKNELINKLNVLDEIHSEQLRHNNVSEEFYSALLNMVAIMAKTQGNSRVASQLDAMVKQVSK